MVSLINYHRSESAGTVCAILYLSSIDPIHTFRYAVAFPWQIDGYKTPIDAVMNHKGEKDNQPFATRLWGEPLVIYRDSKGELVAMADVCPHRSAPLSMGRVENDELVCMYHGWKFGEKGDCVGTYCSLNGHCFLYIALCFGQSSHIFFLVIKKIFQRCTLLMQMGTKVYKALKRSRPA